MLLYICISVASQNKSRAGVLIRKVKRVKEIIMFILGSWAGAVLSAIWMLGIITIARLLIEAGKWIFEFEFKKKEGMKGIND